LITHLPPCVFHTKENTFQGNVDHSIPLIFFEIERRSVVSNGGIVNEDVDATQLGNYI